MVDIIGLTMLNKFYIVIFLICSSVSLILGFDVLLVGKKEALNRVFFVITLLLAIWSFGFAISAGAPDIEACLLWRRVAAFGWATIFAFLLNFSLLFSWRDNNRYLSKWWFICAIYLPAAVCLYVFSISSKMSVHQYALVRISNIWVNTQVNNGWDYFFYSYFFLYSLLTIVMFYKKYRNSLGKEKQYAMTLMLSMGAGISIGTFTDLINASFGFLEIPQIAPLSFLIPVAAISYTVSHHDLMRKSDDNNRGIIMGEDVRNQLAHFLSVLPAFAGITLFVAEYGFNGNMTSNIVVPALGLILMSGLSMLINRIRERKQLIEPLVILVAITIIPILSVHYMLSAAIEMRSLPFAFVVVSALFNNRKLLISTGVTCLFTTLAVWVMVPSAQVQVGSYEYFMYLVFLAGVMWIALFVNKTYVERLREVELRNRMQVLISGVSERLISLNRNNKSEHYKDTLTQIGQIYGGDIALLCFRDSKNFETPQHYIWESSVEISNKVCSEVCNIVSKELSACKVVTNRVITDSNYTQSGNELLERLGIESIASIPLVFTDALTGFLAVGCKKTRCWDNFEIEALNTIANNISESIIKLSAEMEVEFLAYHDHLTKLPNQRLFHDRTEQAIRMAERKNEQIGVVFLDLDAFKHINDSMGHKAGDELLCYVAKELSTCLRNSDTVARFGGDEFLLLLCNTSDRTDFTKIMNKVMSIFGKPIVVQNQEIIITCSAGIAIYPQDGDTVETLIKNADIAMYSAKGKGKNQYLFCSENMKEEIHYIVQLTNQLYRALENKELSLVYQPQVDIETRRVIGAEALLRWNKPELGQISPIIFIPIAEKTGLINSIGEWVLLEACQQAKKWMELELSEIRIAVNISVNQLRNPMFFDQVKGVLETTGLDPSRLELEITESVTMQEPDYIVDLLVKLKTLGLLISIDDFGTEYSSLSRLKQLPIDRIKMDMQFVRGIVTNEKDRAISKIIIKLAKSLNLKVIAEGVENTAQLGYLEQYGCDEVQGFLFARPIPVNEMESVLRDGLLLPRGECQ